MFNIKKKHLNLLKNFTKTEAYIGVKTFDTSIENIFLTGLLNSIWHSWNSFWRTFWLTYIFGGKDLAGKKVVGLYPNLISEGKAVSFLKKNNLMGTIPHFREGSWGSFYELSKVSSNIINHCTSISSTHKILQQAIKVSSILSITGNSIEHFRIVRNASIHPLNKIVIEDLNPIKIHYSITNYKFPADLLFALRTSDRKQAFVSWKDDLTSFIGLI